MYRFKLVIEGKGPLIEIETEAKTLPARFAANLKKRQPETRRKVLQITAIEPPPPQYPLRWSSPEKRRRVIAKLRAENNLPYQRTGALLSQYDVDFRFAGTSGQIDLLNDEAFAAEVVGPIGVQDPMFADIGWISVDTVQAQNEQIVYDDVTQVWVDTIIQG